MDKTKLPIIKSFKDVFLTLKYSIFNIVLFELIYKLATLAVIKPFIGATVAAFIKAGGHNVVINDAIVSFLFGLGGLLMVIIVTASCVVAVYYEYAVLYIFLLAGYRRENVSLIHGIKHGFDCFNALYSPSALGFVLFALGLIPLLNIGIESSLFPSVQIPGFITEEIARYRGGWILLDAIFWAPMIAFAKLSFVLPIMTLQRISFGASVKRSLHLLKGKTLRFAAVMVAAFACRFIVLSLLHYFLEQTIVLHWFFDILIDGVNMLSTPLLLSAILVCFIPAAEADSEIALQPKELPHWVTNAAAKLQKFVWDKCVPEVLKERKVVLMLLLVVPICVNSFDAYTLRSSCLIIGHRGSVAGVENTIKAVNGAVEQKADSAELDIMLSGDGVPMVIHDSSLFRLSGRIASIHDFTAEQLQRMEISNGDKYDRIYTLDEMLKAMRGKMKFLLELKSNGHESGKNVVDAVIEVVRRNGMEADCIYQTLEYPILAELKEKYPDYYSGYIMFTRIGEILPEHIKDLPADFLNIEESMITKELVDASHAAGKPVYVWTVAADAVRYLMSIDVDAIITDYPGLTREMMEDISLNNRIRAE